MLDVSGSDMSFCCQRGMAMPGSLACSLACVVSVGDQRAMQNAECTSCTLPGSFTHAALLAPESWANPYTMPILGLLLQAEKFRAKAHKAEAWRNAAQYCRYLYYMARIRTIQLEYSEAKDCLQQVSANTIAE